MGGWARKLSQTRLGPKSVRSIYTIPFRREVIIPDHWEIPFLGGRCRILEEDGRAKAVEVVFRGEPLANAPHIQELNEGLVKAHITGRDDRLIFVKRHIDQASAFLECLYNTDLATDEIEAKYQGETPEEEDQIAVKGMKVSKADHALPLTFDMLTRALMAAEVADGPKFESTLVKAARNALPSQLYIDSFRYSFLLIESLYGDGQFKNFGLNRAFKGNPIFVAIVQEALVDVMRPKHSQTSDTTALLATGPTPDAIIEHLVNKRGFYFHGNLKRKDAWKPDEQGQAEALALLAIGIAQLIAMKAADPIFESEFEERHFNDAMSVGAKIMFEINFSFREPGEDFPRDGNLTINTPGTKVTKKQANAVAQKFLAHFDHNAPVAALERALCVVKGGNQKVFEIIFHD